MPSINAQTTPFAAIVQTSDGTGNLALQTANVTALTIDTSRRLGVGTTSFQTQSPAGSISIPELASFQTGSFGRAWNPQQQIGGIFSSGRYGMAYTYLAYYDAGWKSLGGGTASAITIDEGIFSFSNTNNVISGGSSLTWATRLSVDTSGNLAFNSGYGSAATAYGCRAWVNFNGTGTVAIRASGNVSSITDNGTGDYTVNFSTAMPDTNYSVATSTAGNTNAYLRQVTSNITVASAVRINTFFSADNANTPLALADFDPVCVSIFR
jgi:hypothetical protein